MVQLLDLPAASIARELGCTSDYVTVLLRQHGLSCAPTDRGHELKVDGQEVLITHQREGTRFSATELRPNGRPLLEQFQQIVAQTNRQLLPRSRDSGIEM